MVSKLVLLFLILNPNPILTAESEFDRFLRVVINFLSDVITKSFPQRGFLLYISDGSPVISGIIEMSIVTANAAIMTMPNILEQKFVDHNFDGYVIVSENITFLRSLFVLKPKNSAFRLHSHKRIVIFFNGNEDFNVHPFSDATSLQGIDIITVSGIDLDFQKYIWENIYTLMNVTVSQVTTERVLASWDYNNEFYFDVEGFDPLHWEPYFGTGQGIEKQPLRFAAADCRPFVFVNSSLNVYEGLEYRILSEIAKDWDIEYNVIEFDDSTNINTKILNDVLAGNSDIGMCSQWVNSASSKGSIISFTHPYTQICTTFLVPKPKLLPLSTYIFQAIHKDTWCATIGFLFTISLVIFSMGRIKANKRYKRYSTCVLDIIRIYTLTCLPKVPSQAYPLLRFTFGLWFITSLLFYTAYSAGFTTSLTFPRYSTPIRTIKDMVDAHISWGGPDYTTKQFFADHPNPYLEALVAYYQIEENLRDRDRRIREDNYALSVKVFPNQFVTDTETLDEYGKTRLRVLEECASETYLVFIMTKNSPYTAIISVQVQKFSEHGLISHWTDQVISKYKAHYMQNFHTSYFIPITAENDPFSLRKIQGVFYLLVVGYAASIVVFVLELMVHNWVDIVKYCNRIRRKLKISL